MRRLILVVFVVMSALCVAPSEMEQDVVVEIAMWKNNASGAVTLSFDDGYLATYESVIPLLDDRGIRGTFNVITKGVGMRYGELELGEWRHWEVAAENGHEVASHTALHIHVDEVTPKQLEQELESSKKAIEENIEHEALSFVYPGGAYDMTSKEVVERFFLSARTSEDGYNNATPEDMHLLRSKTAAAFTAKEMDVWADEAFEDGLWLIENYHLVADENPLNYTFYLPTSDFRHHLDYLSSKRLWIAPQGNVAKYILERDSSNVAVLSASNTKIVLNLTTPLNSSIFDEPITLMIKLPENWVSAAVTQKREKMGSLLFNGTLYIDIIPNRGKIVINRM